MSGNKQHKTVHCSFCSKTERQVRKLLRGPHAMICDECIDLGYELFSMESWELKASREAIRSNKKFQQLVRASESQLLENLGQPDRVGPGSDTFDRSGKLEVKTDKVFMYLSLLPNVKVFFEILDGKVHNIGYIPKQKKGG